MGQYGNSTTEIRVPSADNSTQYSNKQTYKQTYKQRSRVKLDSLPTEVVHGILRYLDTRALREVSRTNRRLYRLVDGASSVWRKTLWVEFGVRLSDL